jgi:hypothetical protein
VQAIGYLIGLPLSADGRRMCGQIASRGDEHVRPRLCTSQEPILAEGCLHRLNSVEIAVFAQQ